MAPFVPKENHCLYGLLARHESGDLAIDIPVIGAASHHVTAAPDEEPIIDQDVMRVAHEDAVSNLVRLGRDLEKSVLAKALWSHVKGKVLASKNKTVVFA